MVRLVAESSVAPVMVTPGIEKLAVLAEASETGLLKTTGIWVGVMVPIRAITGGLVVPCGEMTLAIAGNHASPILFEPV